MNESAHRPTSSISNHCSFCGYPLSLSPLHSESGNTYCTEHCREADEKGTQPFANRFQFKYFSTGVSALDSLLPVGLPTNSFVLLSGEEGIRHRGLQTELVWRALLRGEPAIILTFVDPPVAIIEHFLTFGWNVLPYLEHGSLKIIDCFTNRLRKEHQVPDHQALWNDHLGAFLDKSVELVYETNDFFAIEDQLHDIIDEIDMRETGIIVIDSLNEAEIQGHEYEFEQFIKEVRGDICSRKFVPIFTSTTRTQDGTKATDSAYLFDGIVEMRRTESIVQGVRLKQLSIRKMDGVQYRPYWAAYAKFGTNGFQIFDPQSELASIYGEPPIRMRQV